jgi:hypothetical protein
MQRTFYIHLASFTISQVRYFVRTIALPLTALALFTVACAKKSADTAADTAARSTTQTTSTMSGSDSSTGMGMDPDRTQAGTGVPTGYMALTDRPEAKITDAKYSTNGGKWEVQTGPAHIVYAPQDTFSGVYAVSTTIEQVEKPRHPEAYGIFIGGRNLDDRAKQQYTYFLVRGTGEYLIKTRNGDQTTPVVDWKASPNVPKEDASGKASYDLKVHIAPDTVHFMVGNKLVAGVPKKGLFTDGVAGLRINHNLHVTATPLKGSK